MTPTDDPTPGYAETHGVKRSRMPQFSDDDIDALLKVYPVEHVNPEILRATQGDFNRDKISAIAASGAPFKPIVIGSDYRVVDGHHRWLAAASIKSCTIPVIRLNITGIEAIRILNKKRTLE